MNTKDSPTEVMDTDVLVIGGGLAGCLAAIKARDQGVSCIVVEKANIARSGSGGPGLDHLPSVADVRLNGITPEELVEARETGGWGSITNHRLNLIPSKHSVQVIKELERAGVQVAEEDGTYKFAPGRIRAGTDGAAGRAKLGDFILYRGADLKLKLAEAVRKSGAKVINRSMLVDLLTNEGRVVGATAFNIRDGKYMVIKAKATIISTGGAHRLYQQPYGTYPNRLFLNHYSPLVTGDGAAAAYRAGAKLVNMEFLMIQQMDAGLPPGPRPVLFGGLKNSKGEEILKKHKDLLEKLKGESAYRFMMAAAREKGEVLVWDTTSLPEEVERYWEFMMSNEDPRSLKFMKARGGLRKAPIQSRTHIWGLRRSVAGVIIDEEGKASLPGLFVAGDTQGGAISTGSMGAYAWG
ncbi:MAG: FAD-dependent oxidoreductase [Deltaproteobacteria bacterium]|nr:FAD-dependent oxidoreductase [Deltaproteobacteria bacterium]